METSQDYLELMKVLEKSYHPESRFHDGARHELCLFFLLKEIENLSDSEGIEPDPEGSEINTFD